MKKQRVVVGMSGGVDSSVSALLLKEQGFDVVGLYMTNWKEEDENGCCSAEADYADVRAVSDAVGIPYYTVDFSKEYWDKVFSLFVSEYKKGRTPNPDVLCNREIKFGPFKKFAMGLDADFVATGHYADLKRESGVNMLFRAKDENKDQTYFLNQLTNPQLDNVLFPLANMVKNEVRDYAAAKGIPTATKKDSTGICFIGERDFRRFLKGYIPMQEGKMVDIRTGKEVGVHSGVFYYTAGQRHGLGIGGAGTGEPWFVVSKDVQNNILYVSQGECEQLFSSNLTTEPFNFISGVPSGDGGFIFTKEESYAQKIIGKKFACLARIRHRQALQEATAEVLPDGSVYVDFKKPQRAIQAGQYCALYSGKLCLGGGVIKLEA